MSIEHEALNKKILEIHFKPEGYVSTGDHDFLDKFTTMLKTHGLNPAKLVYRGFDGRLVHPVNGLPRDPLIYAMNLPGWEEQIEGLDITPADYYTKDAVPCIAVYDGDQLAEASMSTHAQLSQDTDVVAYDQVIMGNIKKGSNLADMEPGYVVNEEVVHKNFPDGSPTDALVALVYLDD